MSSESQNISSLNLEKVSGILLDVAGTTTAIHFVEETLVPYVKKNVDEFLKSNWDAEEVQKSISQFEEKDLDATKASELIKTLTDKKDANLGLKSIQGLIYQNGYKTGDLKGHVFEEVPKYLEHWSKSKKVAIFSTGSIESQQLLFKNSVNGDLSQYISKYFDQSHGKKTEGETYEKIAKDLDCSPDNILFLTDDIQEAKAAKSANLVVVLVNREGKSSTTESSAFVVIKSFSDIPLEKSKRKVEEKTLEEPPAKVAKTEKEASSENVEADKKEAEKEPAKLEEKKEEAESMDVDENILSTKTETSDIPAARSKEEPIAVVEESKPETVTTETEVQNQDKEEKIKNDTKKTETDTATQTKTITNECETQTTISITATEELPLEKVQDKLMETESITEISPVDTETMKTESSNLQEKIPVVNESTKSEKCDIDNAKSITSAEKEEKSTDEIEEKNNELEKKKVEVSAEDQENEDIKCNHPCENTKEEKTEEDEDIKCNYPCENAKEEKTDEEKPDTKKDEPAIKKDEPAIKKDEPAIKKDEPAIDDEIKGKKVEIEAEPKENGVTDEKPDKTEEKQDKTEEKQDKTEEKHDKIEEKHDKMEEKHDKIEEKHDKMEEKHDKTEEKENISELANSKENGIENESGQDASDNLKSIDEELKVKKIDEVDSAPVSVEA